MRSDAAEYSAKQKWLAARDSVKAENRQRRLEGLAPLKIPKVFESESKRGVNHNTYEESNSLLSHTDDENYERAQTRAGQKRRRRPFTKDELRYEGRGCND